jgi:hypothetical protein
VHVANHLDHPDADAALDLPVGTLDGVEIPGMSSGEIWDTETLDPQAFTVARITPEMLDAVRAEFGEEWQRAQVFLGLVA